MANLRPENRSSTKPLPSSVVIHGEPSNNLSGGLQALIVQDVEAYDATLCAESYRKYGLPTPPLRDPTIQWLRTVQQPGEKGFVFLQSANKAVPFIAFDRCVSPNRLILTTKAYYKLLKIFYSPQNVKNDTEWMRLERKAQLMLDAMRTNSQTISLAPYLSFVSHGSNTVHQIIETYPGWDLVLEAYGESQWPKGTPSQLFLRYISTSKNTDPTAITTTSNQIQLFSSVLCQITNERVLSFLQKTCREGYFTPAFNPPASPSATIDILAVATSEAQIPKSTAVARRVEKTLRDCGLSDNSATSSSDDEENLDNYSMPVVATSSKATGKVVKKSPSKGSKPYDKPQK